MTEIDARLNTGELAVRLVLQTERSYGTILDVEFAPHVTVNGSPDGFREFARDLLELVDMVAPRPGDVFEDIPPHPEREQRRPRPARCPYCLSTEHSAEYHRPRAPGPKDAA